MRKWDMNILGQRIEQEFTDETKHRRKMRETRDTKTPSTFYLVNIINEFFLGYCINFFYIFVPFAKSCRIESFGAK